MGPVADATVEVLFRDQVIVRGGTDREGLARLGGLPGGTFEVRVGMLGYETKIVPDVRVEVGGARALGVELTLAPIAMEGLTVQAERVQIRRENAEFSTQVDETAIRLLPMTHEATDLVALTPGARPGQIWGGSNFQANNYRIDGLSANHPGLGGDLLQPSVNWIDRVEAKGWGPGPNKAVSRVDWWT